MTEKKKKYKSIYGHEKDSLSWSSYSAWKSGKDTYRKRYYASERPSFETAETIFGKKIGKYLEDGHKEVAHVEKYSHPEHKISVEIEGVKIIGYLDNFDPIKKRFIEYKTSHKNKEGKHNWTALTVAKHKQLDFYSMLIQEKYGKVQNQCKLIYLETQESFIEYKGRKLESVNKGLKLTGDVRVFKRCIEQWERDAIKRDIIKVAKEIKEDYERFRQNN